MRLFVIEDDNDLREMLHAVIELGGWYIDYREASNGLEALSLLATLRDDELPELIILDIGMPVMNGFEFRDAQRADPRIAHIPVLALSASHWSEAQKAEIGAAVFLPKPFTVHGLDLAIHTAVGQGSRELPTRAGRFRRDTEPH